MIYKVRLKETKRWIKDIDIKAYNAEEARLLAEDMYHAGEFPEPHEGKVDFSIENISELGLSDEERMFAAPSERIEYDLRKLLDWLGGKHGWGIPGLLEYLTENLPYRRFDKPYREDEAIKLIKAGARTGQLRMEYMKSERLWNSLQAKYEEYRNLRFDEGRGFLPIGSFFITHQKSLYVIAGLRPGSRKHVYLLSTVYRMTEPHCLFAREKVERYFDENYIRSNMKG